MNENVTIIVNDEKGIEISNTTYTPKEMEANFKEYENQYIENPIDFVGDFINFSIDKLTNTSNNI